MIMATKKLTVTFTRAELLAFCFAAENILSAAGSVAVAQFFGNKHTEMAAYRALAKVNAALRGLHDAGRTKI